LLGGIISGITTSNVATAFAYVTDVRKPESAPNRFLCFLDAVEKTKIDQLLVELRNDKVGMPPRQDEWMWGT
jgi:hypothetical protein